jgi:anti-sigma factor RsiW
MVETCINPAEMGDGDLMAYVDGTADEAIVHHVRLCPACTRQAEELARLQAMLTANLYRRSCPTSEQLIAYRYGELQGGEHLVVAQHLRQCPHCARELAALSHAERRGPGEWLRTTIEVVEAALVTPHVQAAGVRTIPGRDRSTPQVYRADGVEVIVNQHPSRTHPHQWDLVGLVHVAGQVPATIGEARAELYRGEGLIAIEQVSPRGQFTFAGLEPAGYDLGLIWEQREIRLEGIRVQ